MTQYRLKDYNLQQQLDDISNGDFTKQLNAEIEKCSKLDNGWDPNSDRLFVQFGKKIELCNVATLHANEFTYVAEIGTIEAIPQYDPNVWNEYPAVEPPTLGGRFRVEVYIPGSHDGPEITEEKIVKSTCAYLMGNRFVDANNGDYLGMWSNEKIRYKPWN